MMISAKDLIRTISAKEKVKIVKLAQKNTFMMILLSGILTPIIGYLYTERLKALISNCLVFSCY